MKSSTGFDPDSVGNFYKDYATAARELKQRDLEMKLRTNAAYWYYLANLEDEARQQMQLLNTAGRSLKR